MKFIFTTASVCFFPNLALAQSSDAPFAGITPKVQRSDSNNVDMLNAKASINIPLVSFGKPGTEMALNFSLSMPYRKDWDWTTVTSYASVSDLFSYFFTENLDLNPVVDTSYDGINPIRTTSLPFGGGFYDGHTNPEVNSDGSTIRDSLSDTFLTEMTFADSSKNGVYNFAGVKGEFSIYGVANAFQLPTGERWTLYRAAGTSRIISIVSNKGYGIQLNYNGNDISSLKSYNKSKYYCNESSLLACAAISGVQNDVEISYNNTEGSVTFTYPKTGVAKKIAFLKNAKGQVTIRVASVETVGVPESKLNYSYSPIMFTNDSGSWQEPFLSSVTTNEGTWSYTYYRDNNGSLTDSSLVSRTAPDGGKITAEGAFMLGQGKFTDELNRVTNVCVGSGVSYASPCATLPNGKSYNYARDDRGNIKKITIAPATGSGESAIYQYASYSQECLNPLVCNKPLTVTDANGGVTTYTYDGAHGGVLTKIPPVGANGIRPAEKYYYTQRYALVLNASGSFVQASSPIWVLAEVRSCATSSMDVANGTCAAGTADLIKKTFDYGASSGVGSNLLLKGVVTEASGVSSRVCYSYDDWGNAVSETKPNANLSACP